MLRRCRLFMVLCSFITMGPLCSSVVLAQTSKECRVVLSTAASPSGQQAKTRFRVFSPNWEHPVLEENQTKSVQLLESINDDYAREFRLPEMVYLYLENFSDNARYELQPPSITAPMHLRMNFDGIESVKSYAESMSVIVHEYGHALFEANRNHSVFSENFKKVEQDKALASRVNDLSKLSAIAMQEYRSKRVDLGLNELFADSLAILWARDAHAIRNSFYFESAPEKIREKAELRSFLKIHPAEQELSVDEHVLFSPSRSFIGYLLEQDPSLYQDGPAFLKKIWRASDRTNVAVLASPSDEPLQVDRINLMFISYLRAELGRSN